MERKTATKDAAKGSGRATALDSAVYFVLGRERQNHIQV